MIRMELGKDSYAIEIQRGILKDAGQYLNLNRKVMIITDTKVPAIYSEMIAKQCQESYIKIVPVGEGSKSFNMVEEILRDLLQYGFSRKDALVGVGGGVVGDLTGFVASLYMRGIDFYNVPTTLLSQVDSSIGGKTAINLGGIKNIVGAFYQPKAVLVDPDTLQTLPRRQLLNGVAEAVKMGATSDQNLFELFLSDDWEQHLDLIIEKALFVKKCVVEQDEKESHLRKILNFGHTIGHGFESAGHGRYLHGECVALGMLYMTDVTVREQLQAVYDKLGITLPILENFDIEEVKQAIKHDKKATHQHCSVVFVSDIGKGTIQEWTMDEVLNRLEC